MLSARTGELATPGSRYIKVRARFAPKDTVMVKVGDKTVSVYPKIKPSSSDAEKSHAFWVTKAGLERASISFEEKIHFLADRMGLMTQLQAATAQMTDDWNEAWPDLANRTYIVYLNAKRNTDVFVVGKQVLKPIGKRQ